MHIPDGYLSPSTCAGLYAATAPFWYVALRRVKRVLHTRTIPLVALFAAFSFVVMMFNLPLPGGTTGHAVGMGMASIVLGPWVSMLAISMALLIQALFFGDGGITAFGANCFNMAVAGSLVASGVYRLVSRGAALTSKRRVVAAGLAGYAAINAAALLAAVEFGIQPYFFHDRDGAALYAPYPLSITIPAMMIGHLTLAGLAELLLSAGMVRYLQRADPTMLGVTDTDRGKIKANRTISRKLGWALGLALALTPLGIVAVGSAWGEWGPEEFADPAARQQIAASSFHQAPPVRAPSGMEKLSALWKAPVASYQPAFVHNSSVGYLLSALLGACLVAFLTVGVGWLRADRGGFLERTARGLLRAMQDSLYAENVARSRGALQNVDPRVKLAGIGALILAATAVRRIEVLSILFLTAAFLGILSRVALPVLTRVWLAVLGFTGFIAFPALFLVPGDEAFRFPVLPWAITWQGARSTAFLVLRAETTATLCLCLVLCTPWNKLLRALRFFRIPTAALAILEMTHRYVFLLLESARNMLEARQARLVGKLKPSEQRRVAAATAAALLDKSLQLSRDVHQAMEARGFRGEIYLLDDLEMKTADWTQLGAFLSVATILLWLGR